LDLKNKELVNIEEFKKELRKILAKQQSWFFELILN
jgi:hypothetical protein